MINHVPTTHNTQHMSVNPETGWVVLRKAALEVAGGGVGVRATIYEKAGWYASSYHALHLPVKSREMMLGPPFCTHAICSSIVRS